MSDFEKSLKDYADQFKIMPSKRVWNGIYNNLHPGSKWPSITVAIAFVITLVGIGNLNNSPDRLKKPTAPELHPANNSAKEIQNSKAKNENAVSAGSTTAQLSQNTRKQSPLNSFPLPNGNPKSYATQSMASEDRMQDAHKIDVTEHRAPGKNTSVSFRPDYGYNLNDINTPAKENVATVNEQIIGFSNSQEGETASSLTVLSRNAAYDYRDFAFYPVLVSGTMDIGDQAAFTLNKPDHSFDNFIQQTTPSQPAKKTHNSNLLKKRKSKVETTFYLEPTLNFATFRTEEIQASGLMSSSSMVVLNNQSGFGLLRKPRPGFQAGAEATFPLLKKIKLVSGLNMNYSAYSNISNLVHPTFATLLLTDNAGNVYSQNFVTHYGNGESPSTFPLVNYRLAVSIPVGLQYNLFKNENLELDIQSLIQPSFILKSDAYVISADGRYFVNTPGLLRKTNFDGQFGTYLSFYGKGLKWHIGPDVRYQLLSSYKDNFPTKEHFLDYGIRIGISK